MHWKNFSNIICVSSGSSPNHQKAIVFAFENDTWTCVQVRIYLIIESNVSFRSMKDKHRLLNAQSPVEYVTWTGSLTLSQEIRLLQPLLLPWEDLNSVCPLCPLLVLCTTGGRFVSRLTDMSSHWCPCTMVVQCCPWVSGLMFADTVCF